MKHNKDLEYGFGIRTLLYGVAGIIGVAIDGATFWALILTAPPLPVGFINIITYTLGTLTSYLINKRFSFRSSTHSLSLLRFYLTSVVGMAISTAILLLLAKAGIGLLFAKIFATAFAVVCQYAINSNFSLVRKSRLP